MLAGQDRSSRDGQRPAGPARPAWAVLGGDSALGPWRGVVRGAKAPAAPPALALLHGVLAARLAQTGCQGVRAAAAVFHSRFEVDGSVLCVYSPSPPELFEIPFWSPVLPSVERVLALHGI